MTVMWDAAACWYFVLGSLGCEFVMLDSYIPTWVIVHFAVYLIVLYINSFIFKCLMFACVCDHILSRNILDITCAS